MAITLRYTPTDITGKTTELTYQEMNDNLKSFVYSGSFDSGTNTLDLHFLSGSTSHSIDLSGLGGADSYISSASLAGTDLTFTGSGSAFNSTVDLSSLRTLPSAPLNSFQFNSGSTLGGSELYYLEISSSVGLNTTTPEATFHVKAANNASASLLIETDSLGQQESGSARLDFRVADNENGYKKYAIIARNNGDGFGRGSLHFALDHTANPSNAELEDSHLTIQSDGKVLMPNINNTVQPTVIGYNTDSGELTYYSTASFGSGGGVATPIDTGSFYLSSSVSGNTITFTQGDGTTESLTVSGGGASVDTGSFYLSSSVAGNVITFTQGDGTTESLTVDTGSGGGGSSNPGGSDGQVQFNNNGSFGGDSGFTYNSSSDTVTITSVNTSTPSLYVATTETTPALGDVLGEIEGLATFQNRPLGGLRWVGDGAWTSSTPTRLEFQTINTSSIYPATKFQIKNDGQLRANEYGSGNFTGTLTKLLGVTSNGSVIETEQKTVVPWYETTIDTNFTGSYAIQDNALLLTLNNTGNTNANFYLESDPTALGLNGAGTITVLMQITPSSTNGTIKLQYRGMGGSIVDIESSPSFVTRKWILVFAYLGFGTSFKNLHLVSSEQF